MIGLKIRKWMYDIICDNIIIYKWTRMTWILIWPKVASIKNIIQYKNIFSTPTFQVCGDVSMVGIQASDNGSNDDSLAERGSRQHLPEHPGESHTPGLPVQSRSLLWLHVNGSSFCVI